MDRSDGFQCVCWHLSVAMIWCYHGVEDSCAKVQRRIHLFLIIENMNIKQVTHSLVVIQVEIVIHTVVGREAQQGEDCRHKKQINAGAAVQTKRPFQDCCKELLAGIEMRLL